MTPVELPSFAPLSVAGRIESVLDLLEVSRCDALIVTSRNNIRWCTGFTGSAGVLVISSMGSTLITDSRYQNQAPRELTESGCTAQIEIAPRFPRAKAARLEGCARVGLEASSITWASQQEWVDSVEGEPVATDSLILGLRSVKTSAEVERIELAARITDESLEEATDLIRAGISERELAMAIDDGMRRRGAAGPSFDTIVAAGAHSAEPHARPGSSLLSEGDLLVVDCGAVIDGYRSDMTRTFIVGDNPSSDEAIEILDLVTRAQQAGVESVAPAVAACVVDSACRDVINSAGYGAKFGHGTGHGVGLEIHELPAVRKGNAAILQPGHVLTVEPGIYVAGLGGVRIEDTVVVTSTGSRVLTRFPKHSVT